MLIHRVALALAALLPATSPGADYPARVVGVSDGDTITVLSADRVQHRIRLYGIDAPETGQDFGARAKQEASALAFGKTVTVRLRDTDRYGRTVADVILPDGASLNVSMVGRGMAWWYRPYAPRDLKLAASEARARAARRGLWGSPNPTLPWEWRRGGGADQAAGVVGNRNSRLYHKPNCRGAAAMRAEHRVPFRTEADAVAAGYRRARDCRW